MSIGVKYCLARYASRCRIMHTMQLTLNPTPNQETAAAIAAALACALTQDSAGDEPDALLRSSWQAAAALAAQRLPPTRNGAHAAWHAAERARRAERWSFGIIGM
jgi:hypothetical protein